MISAHAAKAEGTKVQCQTCLFQKKIPYKFNHIYQHVCHLEYHVKNGIHITFGKRLQNLFKNLIVKRFSLLWKLKPKQALKLLK